MELGKNPLYHHETKFSGRVPRSVVLEVGLLRRVAAAVTDSLRPANVYRFGKSVIFCTLWAWFGQRSYIIYSLRPGGPIPFLHYRRQSDATIHLEIRDGRNDRTESDGVWLVGLSWLCWGCAVCFLLKSNQLWLAAGYLEPFEAECQLLSQMFDYW